MVKQLLPSKATGGRASKGENTDRAILVLMSLLFVGAFLTLFVVRGIDDNRLTSWQWVFGDADAPKIVGMLVIGLALAFALSKVSLPGRHLGGVLFLSSFLTAAVFWREPEVIVDAARYFTQAKHLELYGVAYFLHGWGREIPAWTDLPLVPFLYGVMFTLWGETRVGVQVFTTLLFSGTVVLTYLIGKTLWDESVGCRAGALLLGMPYLLTQVPLMLVDVPTMFFVTLATFTAIKALGGGGAGWTGVSSAALTCALLSKYSTWPLLTVVPIILLVHPWKDPGRLLLRAAGIILVPMVLVAAVGLWKYDVIVGQIGLLRTYQAPGLTRWRESFASTFLFQIHPFISVAALYSVLVAFARKDRKYAIIGWLLLLVVLLRIERIRYLLVAFPMLALMASYGLREIKSARIRRFTTCGIIVSSLVVAVFGYLPYLTNISAVNVMNAGEYLNSIDAETVEVFALPQAHSVVNPAVSVPLLDLFTRRRIVYHDEPRWSPPPEEIERSPLRFTWEYRNPTYYSSRAEGPNGTAAVVVILAHADQSLPDPVERKIREYRLSKAFEASDEWFQYKTFVRIYQPVPKAPTGRAD